MKAFGSKKGAKTPLGSEPRGVFVYRVNGWRLFHRFQVEEDVEAGAVPESLVDVLVVVVRP